MHNVAEIHNDGVSVYFNSAVIPKKSARIILIIINLLVLMLYIALLLGIAGELKGGGLVSIFVIIPTLYAITLGKSTLWNLYGKEHIIISTNTITSYRDYGFFKTGIKQYPYKKLYYEIEIQREDKDLSTIHFINHTETGVPVILFSSAVFVPTNKLHELVEQLNVVFAIEHLTKDGENYIHLN